MRLSVVIPTLNESACLEGTLRRLAAERPAEIIVCDGGSRDATVAIAQRWARVVRSRPGRGVQQNCGAAAASGELLLFLHADCLPAPGWHEAIQRAAGRPGFHAGCLRMRIAGHRVGFRLLELGVRFRVRLWGLPYGDQGLFVGRTTFWRAGGFPPVELMEDVLLVRRLQRFGPVVGLSHPVEVSARRWERHGVVGQTLRNWALLAACLSGVDPNRLARLYPPVR